MKRNQSILEQASFPKLLLHLCLPTIVIMLVMVVYNMADTFFIGQTGQPEKIAAISLCGPLFSILSGMGTLFGSGGCTAVSMALGKKEYSRIRSYTSLCCYGSLAIGILFSVFVFFLAEPLSLALGADSGTLSYTCSYLRIIALGAPVILFNNIFANIIRADGAAAESMIANGLGTITNIVLDALFILGFSWDVTGAALATVLGNAVSTLYLISYILKKQPAFSLRLRDFSLRKEILVPVVTLGLPLACSTILMSCSSMVSNRLVMGYGSAALAAIGVSGKIGMLLSMLAMGICMGLQPAISYNFGRNDWKRVGSLIRNTGLFTVLVGSLLTILCFLFRNPIIAAFIHNEEVISYGQVMVFSSLLSGPIYGLYQLCQTFLQSTGKASYATFVAILDKGLFYLPILLIMSRLFGLYGIVFSANVTLLCSLITGALLSFRWERQAKQLWIESPSAKAPTAKAESEAAAA